MMSTSLYVCLLLIVGVVALAIRARRSSSGSEIQSQSQTSKPNPALEYIRSMPQNHITEILVAQLQAISDKLIAEAKNSSKILGLEKARFVDCIFDLELSGGFDKVLDFTQDKALASAYMDALVFNATSADPSALPTDIEYELGGTENYRGVAKYAEAGNRFSVSSPDCWLFGKEYSRIKSGNAKDFAHVASIQPAAKTIKDTGALIFEHMLRKP